ncbi:hypothetical protein IFM89_024508 [Coptis chinensis]|uniref:Uncharacterized protein n=1 Tax=Coptis chinensis TaxID=261450 RepID=A0A835H6R0_9MAGN|nr:hypothetical protein IFM89_024508 [Coptis chinensis]
MSWLNVIYSFLVCKPELNKFFAFLFTYKLTLQKFILSKVEDVNKGPVENEGELKSLTTTKGGWKSANLLLVNQSLATLAFFGVAVNLVLFLTKVLHYDNAEAANSVSKWTGTVYLFSLVGAFLSDSYWGRYLTCIIFQLIFLLGLVLLSFSSWLVLIKPNGCGDGFLQCTPTSLVGNSIFYISIYLIALGYGGYQPTIATFGADQFNEADPIQGHSKTAFFCYFYFALNAGSLFSNTILVYFEDRGHWVMGFWASAAAAAIGILLFCFGTHGYRYLKPCGNPLTRVAQVFVATFKKWNVTVPSGGVKLYEVEGSESSIRGSRKILHSEDFRFLDKAATMTEPELHRQTPFDPWRLCTITQVEEFEQGDVMKCKFGNFRLPAASMSAFDIMSVLIFTLVYRQLLIPVTGKLTGNPKGLTELQRMGIGLFIGMLAMVAAGITEIERRKHAIPGVESSSLSVFWQIPQYILVGASEVFMYVAQLDFFNTQAPDGLKSFGSSLCMTSISLGNYASSMLVNMVVAVTARGDSPGWIPINLNFGHLDRFYFLISALAAVDFVAYLFCAKWYKCINLESEKGDEMEDQLDDILRRV